MNFKKVAIASALALAVTGMSVSAQAADKKILLKTPIAFGSHLPALGTPIQWYADHITTTSGGTIKMKIYEPGKLVNPAEILMPYRQVRSTPATQLRATGKVNCQLRHSFLRFLLALKLVNTWHGFTLVTV